MVHHKYRASKDLILVQTVQLKSMIRAHSSEKMVSSDVVIATVHSEKTRPMMKMIMMMIIIMK